MHRFVQLALAGSTCLALPVLPVRAQSVPTVEQAAPSSSPAIPRDQKVTCLQGPDVLASAATCPVLKFNGTTYWANSYMDNRVSMIITAFDPGGRIIKQWDKPGARYIWQINVDPEKNTVAFVGQARGTITMSWDELDLASSGPGTLAFVPVTAPAINCVFNPNCTVQVTDSVGTIPVPPNVTGTARLQTRTFTGAAGTPGAGKTAYLYRVDMTQAVSDGEVPCVTDLEVDFGPIAKLQYDGIGPTDDGFVITRGGLGSVGLYVATKSGNVVTLTFNQPVCAGATPGTGMSSYFIGLASAQAPKAVTAKVGWPGLEALDVPARAPAY